MTDNQTRSRRLLALSLIVLVAIAMMYLVYRQNQADMRPNAPRDSPKPAAAVLPAHPKFQPIATVAWNVESGGSKPATIAAQLADFRDRDVIALSEVDPGAFDTYRNAMGEGFSIVKGDTGKGDRLALIFNSKRFELVRQQQLDRYREWTLNNGNHRAPLIAHLRDRTTGQELQLVVVHLARGKEEVRNEQAIGLREWARDQKLPSVLIGDCNMDYDFHTKRGNQAFVEIQRDNVWKWVEPKELIDTNWADMNRDGVDDYPDSMLDFAFVAGPAKSWKADCEVIMRPGDFPDNRDHSDHRPIELRLAE